MNNYDRAKERYLREVRKRREKALALRGKGNTFAIIGAHFGVTRQRAEQMVKKAGEEAKGAL